MTTDNDIKELRPDDRLMLMTAARMALAAAKAGKGWIDLSAMEKLRLEDAAQLGEPSDGYELEAVGQIIVGVARDLEELGESISSIAFDLIWEAEQRAEEVEPE